MNAMRCPPLHPLVEAGMPAARERIKRYRAEGVIRDDVHSVVNMNSLAKRQHADFMAFEAKREKQQAELNARIARRNALLKITAANMRKAEQAEKEKEQDNE